MTQVETRSYTTMCKLWEKLRIDRPPTYEQWVRNVAVGRVIIIPNLVG